MAGEEKTLAGRVPLRPRRRSLGWDVYRSAAIVCLIDGSLLSNDLPTRVGSFYDELPVVLLHGHRERRYRRLRQQANARVSDSQQQPGSGNVAPLSELVNLF